MRAQIRPEFEGLDPDRKPRKLLSRQSAEKLVPCLQPPGLFGSKAITTNTRNRVIIVEVFLYSPTVLVPTLDGTSGQQRDNVEGRILWAKLGDNEDTFAYLRGPPSIRRKQVWA